MPFAHDMVYSLATLIDLINTSPSVGGEEGLGDLRALGEFVERQQVSNVGRLRAADLTEVRALRESFHRVIVAPDRATVIIRLNTLLGGTRITPTLAEHDGHPLHIHYFAPGASLAERLSADLGVALAYLLVEDEWERLRSCSAPDCDHFFLDESRNRSRVYCDSRTCGNRMHVAAYRARRRA
ncbi:CGNR zinc finger domain-containing protein [Streptosporangium sandarakinum]|uniref:CGNR zinc finger domain-containing protein n=1 Tax=Streptosporangium sandarakinum TaxID=1260955 RepID=UPI00344310D4